MHMQYMLSKTESIVTVYLSVHQVAKTMKLAKVKINFSVPAHIAIFI